jgi:hypothetical protein
MNKQQLMEILQTTLLSYDGVCESDLNKLMDPQNVSIGVKMYKFLMKKLK